MQFKDFTKSLLTLILSLVILFSSVTLVYTFLKVDVFNLGPDYIDYYRCEDVYPESEKTMLEIDRTKCKEEVSLEAQKRTANDAKKTYLYTIVMLVFASPLYVLNRKGLL